MRHAEPKVKKLIEQKPILGTNDTKLWIAYLNVYDKVPIIDGKVAVTDLIDSTPFETVSRARRKIAEKHPELFSEEVQEKRYELFKEAVDEYGKPIMRRYWND